LANALQTARPYSWGISHCKIDPLQLLNGQLRVTELEAVMPDGTLIQLAPPEDEELSLDLGAQMETLRERPLKAYLCLPVHHPELLASVRYRSVDSEPIADENTGESAIVIPRVKPRISLAIGAEPPSRFSYFPLLELDLRNENVIATDYIPPLLTIGAHTELMAWMTKMAMQMREKASFLAEQLHSHTLRSRRQQSILYDTKANLEGLIAPLPPLEALLFSAVHHPYTLYLHLCGLAGFLAAFTAGLLPPVFPAYDHNDIRKSFAPVMEFVQKLLDRIQESYQVLSFHEEDGIHHLLPEPEWLGKSFIIGLRGGAKVTDAQLQAWGDSCVIGTDDRIESMRMRRVLGPQRERIEADEEMGLAPPPGVVLLRVRNDPEFIGEGRPLQVVNEERSLTAPREILFYLKR